MKLNSIRWRLLSEMATEPSPKIVLLHGMGGTSGLWRPLAASLEDHMDVLALDQRGHGKSQITGPAQYSPLDFGQDVVETLESLSFSPTWILGHSMGVRTAVATAHLKPEWVQGLVLIDLGFSGVAGGGLGIDLARFLKQVPPTFASRDEARNFMAKYCPDPAIAQYLMAVLVKNTSGIYSFPFDQKALIETIEAAGQSSVREWLQELPSIPTLVLRGKNSLVWSPEDYEKERQFFKNQPSIQFFEIENAGHGLPFEQRGVLVSLLKERILNR